MARDNYEELTCLKYGGWLTSVQMGLQRLSRTPLCSNTFYGIKLWCGYMEM